MENNKTEKQKTGRRNLVGTIVGLPGVQTAVVEIAETKQHPKYKKRYTRTKRFHAHIGAAEVKIGQTVTIVEARPYSSLKRWRVKA